VARPTRDKDLVDLHWRQMGPLRIGRDLRSHQPRDRSLNRRGSPGKPIWRPEGHRCARETFDRGPWSERTPAGRSQAVWKLADLVEQNVDEITSLSAAP